MWINSHVGKCNYNVFVTIKMTFLYEGRMRNFLEFFRVTQLTSIVFFNQWEIYCLLYICVQSAVLFDCVYVNVLENDTLLGFWEMNLPGALFSPSTL